MEKIIQIACGAETGRPVRVFALSSSGGIYTRTPSSEWRKLTNPLDAEEQDPI